MKMKKVLSLLLAVVLIASAAAIAAAESVETPAADTVTAETAETPEAAPAETTYTLDEMLNLAMTDAYARQAAYAAYAEAFPDNRAVAGINIDSQIVLLEMLLKAHSMTLPMATADVTVPETASEALLAVGEAERNAVAMMRAYLSQEALTDDARLIFRSVLSSSQQNAAAFAGRARAAKRAEEWQAIWNGDDMQKYVIEGKPNQGNGSWTVYIVTNNPDMVPEGAQLVDDAAAEPAAEPATETTGN